MTTTHRRTLAAVAGTAVLLIGLILTVVLRGGDSGSDTRRPDAAASATATPDPDAAPVLIPGRPGESAQVVAPEAVPTYRGQTYNTMDAWFLRMMIPHHTQALQMATLAADRAGNPQLKSLADRIKAGQAPEILRMRGWLEARDIDADAAHSQHETSMMAGMQTPEAMRDLASARGADFDRMFVAMMINHHEGAIKMATDVLLTGIDVEVEKIANDVAAEQAIEITRMRDLLAG